MPVNKVIFATPLLAKTGKLGGIRNGRSAIEPKGRPVKAEVYRKLQEADWAAIGKALAAYATWKAQNLAWRTGDIHNLACGLQGVDIAQTAIEKVLNDKREWEPERGELLPYLKGVVDSLMSHLAESADNTVQARFAKDPQGKELVDQAEFQAARNDDSGLLSSHQSLRKTNSDRDGARVAELFAAVEGQGDLMDVLDVVMSSGETKPAEIAAQLGIEVTVVYNRLKRLRHAALQLKTQPRSEYKANTRRTGPV